MSDLINRKQALDDARSWVGMNWYEQHLMRNVVEWLEEFPSPWIPVEKECPKEEGSYIVTIQCEHVDGWDDYVTGFADWSERGWDIICFYPGQIKVVAWMELPSPYKGETNDNI